MAKDTKKTGIIVFVIIVVIAILAVIIQMVNPDFESSNSGDVWNTERFSYSSNQKPIVIKTGSNKKDYIAELVISGTIQEANRTYNQVWLLETIQTLSKDNHNKGIILYIDSPGGSVYQADEAYLALLDYKLATGRPIYAYFASIAASGGYYIGCSADYIMANRNCLTGSIGVISGNFIDLTGLMEQYGIKYTTVTAGRNKNMGNYNQPFTDEQKAIMQSIADECYDQFTGIVAEARDMDIKYVHELADGRIYTAKQALNNGLIDGIGNFDSIINYMTSMEYDYEDYKIVKYEYVMKDSFYSRMMGIISAIRGSNASSQSALPEVLEKAIQQDIQFPAYYYHK